MVMLRTIDFAAGSIEISLEIPAFPAVQSVTGPAVDAFLGANGGLVGTQPVQLPARELVILPAVPDALNLAMFPGIDAPRPLIGRLILREGAQRPREHESKCHRDNSSNQHASSFGHWLSV
jgi:hypothetical protein